MRIVRAEGSEMRKKVRDKNVEDEDIENFLSRRRGKRNFCVLYSGKKVIGTRSETKIKKVKLG